MVDKEVSRCANLYLRGRLIDSRWGVRPYGALVLAFVSGHIGLEHHGTLHGGDCVDAWGRAYEISLASESCDSGLCTCVLEHLEEPERALRECHRVLREGG
jgi:SAM-dependent methyltransferase